MAQAEINRSIGNLGAELTSFVGRRREATEVGRLLGSSRLVTLTGVGGVGKTRLACKVGVDRRRQFRDGVWFVDLAPLEDAALLAETVASVLGMADPGSTWPVSALSRYLKDKSVLLIFDNCEHLRDSCAILLDTLLRAAPDLRALVTSRQSLGLTGEHVFYVSPLSVPDDRAELTSVSVTRYEAVDLFVERARAVRPTFELNEGNVAAVVAVCQRLDGIPLALELAAARVSTLSVGDLLQRLEDRFGLLTSGSSASVPRHQTLSELIGWSWELCSDEEQALWARASVFSSGFDLQAAETVCADGALATRDVLDALTGLVEKTVVTVHDPGGGVRYRMLETLRQFGQSQLALVEGGTAFQDKHRAYYSRLASMASDDWFSERQKSWLDWFRLEHSNIRAALESSFEQPDTTVDGLKVVADLWVFWFATGRTSEARHWLDRALLCPSLPVPARRAALARSAYLSVIQQDLPNARAIILELEGSQPDVDEASDPEWSTPWISALLAMSEGHLSRAESLLAEALALIGPSARLQWQQEVAFCRALVKALSGDVASSDEICRESIETADRHGERSIKSYMLWCWGLTAFQAGQPDQAAARGRDALEIALSLEDEPFVVASCFELLAWIGAASGRFKSSARLLGAAEAIWSDSGWFLRSVHQLAQHHDECLSTLRAQLGKDELAAAMTAGSSVPWSRLATEVLGTSDVETPRNPGRTAALGKLTKRETEVADLLAQGLTNKAIAARLVIAPRTAEAHVERIFTKLDVNSRAQVAAWVVSERTGLS